MIIEIEPKHKDNPLIQKYTDHYDAFLVEEQDRLLMITGAGVTDVEPDLEPIAAKKHVFPNDMQLSSLTFAPKRRVTVKGIGIGGTSNNTILIGGPCSVESREQAEKAADAIANSGGRFFRAGAYKPRTSPYSFQGLGFEGLKLLREICDKRGLILVSEARDATHIDEILEMVDVVQIGAKAMYDHGILRACGMNRKPVLLKRGFGAALQEFVQAAEFILSLGNPNVVLCELGIRTFENKTRFTLDLCGVAYLKHHTNLPIVVDPSHAMGYRYGVADLARASVAMKIDGLLIEAHPTPDQAKSDAAQQLSLDEFQELRTSLSRLAPCIGMNLV